MNGKENNCILKHLCENKTRKVISNKLRVDLKCTFYPHIVTVKYKGKIKQSRKRMQRIEKSSCHNTSVIPCHFKIPSITLSSWCLKIEHEGWYTVHSKSNWWLKIICRNFIWNEHLQTRSASHNLKSSRLVRKNRDNAYILYVACMSIFYGLKRQWCLVLPGLKYA